jgi:hypothetical protein
VIPTVDLYDQPFRGTGKVSEEWANGMLATEPQKRWKSRLRGWIESRWSNRLTFCLSATVLWYNYSMIRLSREQTEEALRNPEGAECEGDGGKLFVIMDAESVRRMKETLYRKDVNDSIAAGIADMEAGRTMTAEEADDHIRSECGLPPRKAS